MKRLYLIMVTMMVMFGITACTDTQADRVTYNLSQEADNFNRVRQVTVINCIQGDVLFQMTGKISIKADRADNQLEIVIEDENGNYKKGIIGLSDNVTYVVDDLDVADISNYKYTLNFNPKMWIPIEFETID